MAVKKRGTSVTGLQFRATLMPHKDLLTVALFRTGSLKVHTQGSSRTQTGRVLEPGPAAAGIGAKVIQAFGVDVTQHQLGCAFIHICNAYASKHVNTCRLTIVAKFIQT